MILNRFVWFSFLQDYSAYTDCEYSEDDGDFYLIGTARKGKLISVHIIHKWICANLVLLRYYLNQRRPQRSLIVKETQGGIHMEITVKIKNDWLKIWTCVLRRYIEEVVNSRAKKHIRRCIRINCGYLRAIYVSFFRYELIWSQPE